MELGSPIVKDDVPNQALCGTALAMLMEADTRREEIGATATASPHWERVTGFTIQQMMTKSLSGLDAERSRPQVIAGSKPSSIQGAHILVVGNRK